MRNRLLLLILLSIGFIYSELTTDKVVPTLNLGSDIISINLSNKNDTQFFKISKDIQDKESLVFQIFESNKAFKKFSIQLGYIEEKTVVVDEGNQNSTTYTFNNTTNLACPMIKLNQKCLWTTNLSQVKAVSFTCLETPCSANFKAYSILPYELKEEKEKEELTYEQDIILVKYDIQKKNPYRTIVETRLANSLASKANDTTVQYFHIKNQKTQIIEDTLLSHIEYPNQESNKQYYAIYSGKKNSTIIIKAKTYSNSEMLVPGKTYTDYFTKSYFSKNLAYQLNFKEGSEFDYLKFIFKWYELKQGEVTLVASCSSNTILTDSFWYSTLTPSIESEKLDEDSQFNKQYSLIISQTTASKFYTQNIPMFYFGLNSQVDSGFFKFSIQVSKKTYPDILPNEMLAGKMRGDDIINIILVSPRSTEEYLTVDMKNNMGGANLYVRECKSTDCIQEAYTQDNKDKMESKTSRLESDYVTKSISFIPNCATSIQGQESDKCYYMVGLIPTNQNQISDYIVEAFSDIIDQQILLTENKVFGNQININEYQYYALYLEKTSDIKSISVKTSSPHVQLYVSVDNNCMKPTPDCTDSSKVLLKGLNTKPIVIANKDTQRGAIYVGIYGYTATLYSVVVEVDRVDQTLITQAQSGELYYGQLSKSKRRQYFIFDPSQQVSKEDQGKYDFQDIEINVRGAKDKIVIMVNNDGTMPYEGENGFMWSSNNGILFISKNDPQFKKDAVYKICLMATEHAFELLPTVRDTIQNSNDLQFQMLITSDAHTKHIELGNPIHDQLEPNDSKMYTIHLLNSNFTYIISTNSNDHVDKKLNITMKIGSQPYGKDESYEFNYPFSVNQHVIKGEDINKLCKGKESCDVFIAIQSQMNLFVSFSLTVWNTDFAIELKEGIQYQNGLHYIDGVQNFYYYPSNKDHPLNIFSSSVYGHTGFNVFIYDNKEKKPSLLWPYPSSSNKNDLAKYHFISGVHNQHSINFQATAFDSCWPDCVVLISLSYYKGLPVDGSDHTVDEIVNNQDIELDRINDKFIILVSTIYSDFHFNQQMEFTLENQESKFFYLSLSNILAEKDSLQIEMTSLSGKAVIGAMIKDDTHNRYPSISNQHHDFVTYSNYLEISNKRLEALIKKLSISKTANPQLIIEVTCVSPSAGKFVLVAMQGKSNAIDLMHGLPQEVYLRPNKVKYFKYFHFSDSDFTVKFSREIGFPDLQLIVCKKSKSSSYQDFKQCLDQNKPSVTLHTAGETAQAIQVSRNNTKLFCQNCLYIVQLSVDEEGAETHGFLNVLLQQDFTWLQEGRQIVDNVEAKGLNFYRLSVDSDEETFITLQQYTGDIELYYSYRYSYMLKDYVGPFKVSSNDKFIHLTLRPRQDYEEDENFNTYNKPYLVPIVNKNDESKKNSNETINNSQNVQFDDLSEFFYEAEVYLIVKNIDKRGITTDYSLVFHGGDQYRYLYDGQIMGSSIPPQKKITYLYSHFENEAPARLNIFSHSKFFSMENHLTLLGFHDLQKNSQDYKDITRDPIPLELIAAHEYSMSYKLPERNGTYELVFTNEHETKTLNISLSINSRDMLLIPLNQQIEHALTAQSVNYYEIIAPKDGFMTLTITHCTGQFELLVSTDFQEILNHQFDLKFKSTPGTTNVHSFKVKKGNIYFSVTSSLEESFYKIRPDFFTSEKQIPHNNILPGNEGVVYHKRKMGGLTEISFSPVICSVCSSEVLSKSRVQYDVIYSTDIEILNVLGKCSASNYFEHEAKNKLHFKNSVDAKEVLKKNNLKQKTVYFDLKYTEDIKFTINLDNDESIFYVSVVASITNIPNKDLKDVKVFYENSQIGKVQVFVQGEASIYAFLFACILIMIFFCMTTCLFWRRYKTMQQGLEVSHKWRDIEMQQEKRKQMTQQKMNSSSQNLDETTQVNITRDNNLDDSFAGKPFENPDLYVPSDNDLRSHFKSEAPSEPKQEVTENPFDKISIKINPPPSTVKTTTKSGYDQFIDEN